MIREFKKLNREEINFEVEEKNHIVSYKKNFPFHPGNDFRPQTYMFLDFLAAVPSRRKGTMTPRTLLRMRALRAGGTGCCGDILISTLVKNGRKGNCG